MFWSSVNSRFLPLGLHEVFPERIAGSTRKSCLYSQQLYSLCASQTRRGIDVSGITLQGTGSVCAPLCLCNPNKTHISVQVRQVTATAPNDSALKFSTVPPTHTLASKSLSLSPLNLDGCRISGIFSGATEVGHPVTTCIVMSKLQGSFADVTLFCYQQFRLWLSCMWKFFF